MPQTPKNEMQKANSENELRQFTLVNGVFEREEAREVLMNLYETKIRFHENRNFNSLERFGHQEEKDQSRIIALKLAREQLKVHLNASKAETRFEIKAFIEITPI